MGKRGIRVDITGQKFGRLTAVEFLRTVNGISLWRCRCDCGNEKISTLNHLRKGHCKSCGCLMKNYIESGLPANAKKAAESNVTHGESKSKLFRTWTAMRNRCSNPKNPAYKWYGAKGVKVCEEWSVYETFRKWSYDNGYDDSIKGHTQSIDRIDPNGDYCPGNCRWTDVKTQNENKACVRVYEYNGETGTLGYFARKYGYCEDTLRWRVLKMKEPIDKALTRGLWQKS